RMKRFSAPASRAAPPARGAAATVIRSRTVPVRDPEMPQPGAFETLRGRAAGQGDGRHQLCIGDIRVDLKSDDPTMEVDVCRTTRRFLVEGDRADARVSAAWGDLRRPAAGDEIFDSGGLWKLYRD